MYETVSRCVLSTSADLFSPAAMGGMAASAVLAIIGFLVTAFVLKRFLFKPVAKIVRARQEDVERTAKAQEEEAARLKTTAQTLDDDKQAFASEMRQKRHEQTKEAAQAKRLALDEAQEQTSAMLREAADAIERQREAARDSLHEQAIDVAVASLAELCRTPIDEVGQRRLSDAVTARIEGDEATSTAQLVNDALAALRTETKKVACDAFRHLHDRPLSSDDDAALSAALAKRLRLIERDPKLPERAAQWMKTVRGQIRLHDLVLDTAVAAVAEVSGTPIDGNTAQMPDKPLLT